MQRLRHRAAVEAALRINPVVAVLGARQVGKTTLAHQVVARRKANATFFDLERAEDLRQLQDPFVALEPLRGLVVLDEIQHRPDIFACLRVLADRRPLPARFLVLGSAAPDLLRQSSESLAGRIHYHELGGFGLDEVGAESASRLWLRGGFPRAYLARSQAASTAWRENLVRTYVERDLPQLGVQAPRAMLERFWAMLAHYHGQTWNAAELARSFGISETTVRRYVDLMAGTYMVRLLQPWHENLGKRIVKSPKVYVSDSGLLHTLLGIREARELERHPKVGASWEGFALATVERRLRIGTRDSYFWATHAGAELDLLVVRGTRRLGFEFKRTTAPDVTKSMRIALEELGLERLDVIHAGTRTFALAPRVRAVALARVLQDVEHMS